MSEEILTDQRINVLDQFVRNVMRAYKRGEVDLDSAVSAVGHIFVSIDKRNETEIQTYPKNWRP